jgi:hypothetical protein
MFFKKKKNFNTINYFLCVFNKFYYKNILKILNKKSVKKLEDFEI